MLTNNNEKYNCSRIWNLKRKCHKNGFNTKYVYKNCLLTLPEDFHHVTLGVGKPVAEHSIEIFSPAEMYASFGSRSHFGGSKYNRKINNKRFKMP